MSGSVFTLEFGGTFARFARVGNHPVEFGEVGQRSRWQGEGVHDVTRKSRRGDQHRIASQGPVRGPPITRLPVMCRTREPSLLRRRDRQSGAIEIRPGLHFHEHDGVSTPRNQVDLAAIAAVTASQDAIALEHQEHGGGIFRPIAQSERSATLMSRPPAGPSAIRSRRGHCFFNSTARA